MTNDKTIWEFLKSQGLNDYGAAGLMGNLYAESGLSPTNLQNTYNNKFGMTDDEYTAAVDAGRYGNFVHDSAGYGLAQWTFWSRKQGLYDYAKSTGRSIGDLTMQLEFLFQELSSGYKSVLSTLKSATSVLQASNSVLLQFERPADQSVSVQNKRASYGQNYYNQFAGAAQEGGSVGMSNSPLVEYTRISPNRSSPRRNAIDRISIHCVVGQVSIQSLGSVFAPSSREASSNYGIGYDGRIGMYVEEKDRSWCTSSSANDNRAVTIEVASDTSDPYAVTEAAYAGLLNLVTDICKRNGKNTLIWFGDKNTALNYTPKSNEMVLTVHRWFANKSCPGNWMYARMGDLAEKVTTQLGGGISGNTETEHPEKLTEGYYRVRKTWADSKTQKGAYKILSNAKRCADSNPGYSVFDDNGVNIYSPGGAASAPSEDVPFLVQVSISDLNIRKGPGTDYAKTGKFTGKGVFTIMEVKSGQGSTAGWGRLKSGAGWISLDYTSKIK